MKPSTLFSLTLIFYFKMTVLRKVYFIHSSYFELATKHRFYHYNRNMLENKEDTVLSINTIL